MFLKTRITQKGQITLPKIVRDRLKIKPRTEVMIELQEKTNEVRIRPVIDFVEVAQSITPRKNKGVDVLKAREFMQTNYERT